MLVSRYLPITASVAVGLALATPPGPAAAQSMQRGPLVAPSISTPGFDPGGVVTDAATGKPLAGARVTLYRVPGWSPRTGPEQDTTPNTCESNSSKPAGSPWSQPAPTNDAQEVDPSTSSISPAVNPLSSSSTGRYGWSVPAGCWFVVVTNPPDYYAYTSPVVGTPTAVTDLDVKMSRPQSGGGGGGGAGSGTGGGSGGGDVPGQGPASTVRCKVPRVLGLSLRRAKRSLKKAHCRVGSVTWSARRARKRHGTVLRQRPRPGTRKRSGARVALRLSK
jgi:hypothetical protein